MVLGASQRALPEAPLTEIAVVSRDLIAMSEVRSLQVPAASERHGGRQDAGRMPLQCASKQARTTLRPRHIVVTTFLGTWLAKRRRPPRSEPMVKNLRRPDRQRHDGCASARAPLSGTYSQLSRWQLSVRVSAHSLSGTFPLAREAAIAARGGNCCYNRCEAHEHTQLQKPALLESPNMDGRSS